MKKILIIEDDTKVCAKYQSVLGGSFELLFAHCQRDARVLLRDHSDISLVVLDGIVPNFMNEEMRFTYNLVHDIFRRHEGTPIVAASKEDEVNKTLLAKGCQHFVSEKSVVALEKLVRTLLPATH